MPPDLLARVAITAANRGPLINIGTWILLVSMVLTVISKVVSKLLLLKALELDDAHIALAAMFAIGQGIATTEQVQGGLGQHRSDINSLLKFEQAGYAADFLYIASLSFSRVALLQFLLVLFGIRERRFAVFGMMGFEAVWSVVALLCVAFRCSLPDPWDFTSGKCIQENTFWIAFTVVTVVLDIILVAAPAQLLWSLKFTFARKATLSSVFFLRLCLIPLAVLRAFYIDQNASNEDVTYASFNAVLTTVIQVNVSVIITCIPFLKPVMDSLQTGLWTSDLRNNSLAITSHGSDPSNYRLKRLGEYSRQNSKFKNPETLAPIKFNTDLEYQDPAIDSRATTSSESQEKLLQHKTSILADYGRPSPRGHYHMIDPLADDAD